MPFVPTPGTIEVVLNQTYFNELVVNVLNVRVPTPGDGVSAAQVATDVEAFWQTYMRPNVSTSLALASIVVRDISVEDGQVGTFLPTGNTAGEQNSPGLPASVALCVTHRTNRAGRSYRGRTYVCGMVEQFVTGNLVDNSLAQNIAGGFNALRATLAGHGFELGVKSLRNNKQPRTVGEFTPIQTSLVRDLRVDSQRRRLPR